MITIPESLVCFILTIPGLETVTVNNLYAAETANFEHRLVTGSVLNRFTECMTVVECLTKCSEDCHCQTFFYNPFSQVCQTNGVEFFPDANWTASNGTSYYTTHHILCRSFEGYSYQRAGEMCYKIHRDETLHWPDARRVCLQEGADLIILNTDVRFKFIVETMKASAGLSAETARLLIGVSDAETEGDWRWVDGSHFPKTSPFWSDSQPNNVGNQDYASIRTTNYKLDDSKGAYGFVCEIKL